MSKKVSVLLLEKLGERIRKNKELARTEWAKYKTDCPHISKITGGCIKPDRYGAREGASAVCAVDVCPFITGDDKK